MRAVGIESVGVVKMTEIPMPRINEYECLVKMHACGFCNCTDTESIMNTHIHKDMPFPHIQGHEGVGEIVEKGAKVFSFEIGDRIVFPEGRIDPASGYAMCGCGHFADYCIVRDCEALKKDGLPLETVFADWPRKYPKEISYLDATMITPIRETLSAVRNFGIGPGSRVLIVGDGPRALDWRCSAGWRVRNLWRWRVIGRIACAMLWRTQRQIWSSTPMIRIVSSC